MPPLLTQVSRGMDGLPLVATLTPQPGLPVTNQHQQEAKDLIRSFTGGGPTRMSVVSGDRVFSFMTRDNLCFITQTESKYSKRLAFQYLDDIADVLTEELTKEFGNQWRGEVDQTARPFRFIQYDPIIQRKQREYRDITQQQQGSKSRLNEDLTEIQSIMRKNIDEILNRGEKLDHVSSISDELKKKSKDFKWGTKKLTLQAQLQQFGPMIVGMAIVLIVIYVKIFHIGF